VTSLLLAAARDRPIVIVLDDLHWADEPSLLLLRFAARELASSGLLILGTYRDVELGATTRSPACWGRSRTSRGAGGSCCAASASVRSSAISR
jgi:predicted ATPase